MAVTAAEAELGYRVRPLTREAYDILVESGVYDDVHIELLDGELVEMAPQGPEHSDVLGRLAWALQRSLDALAPRAYFVRQQSPLATGDVSVPEPDISVVDNGASSPARHPVTAHLAIEIAKSSHRIDLVRKPALYAAAGVPSYWVVDLVARQVVLHGNPYPAGSAIPAGYGSIERVSLDTPLEVLGVTITISEAVAV